MNTPSIDELKRHRRLGRKMLALFKEMDPKVARSMEGLTPSCKLGCSSCCYLLALVSLPEAVAVAEYILSNVNRRKQVPELSNKFWLAAQAIESGGIKEIRTKYFKKKVPCAFLDTEKNSCAVYDVRPGACRYHFVVSDPKDCSPDVEAQVARINTVEAEVVCLSEANRVSGQAKMELYVAPMPIVMLWAFKLLIEGRDAFDAALKETNLGVLNLNGWVQTLHADEAPSAASPEVQPETVVPEAPKTPVPETIAGGSD